MGAATLDRGDVHACPRERASVRKASQPTLGGYERAPGGLIAVNWVERDRGQRGASAEGPEGGARRTCGS